MEAELVQDVIIAAESPQGSPTGRESPGSSCAAVLSSTGIPISVPSRLASAFCDGCGDAGKCCLCWVVNT